MEDILWFLGLLTVGFIFGTRTEKKHFRSLAAREQALAQHPLLSTDEGYDPNAVSSARLVRGAISIGPDYFRVVVAAIIGLVGGRIGVYENLLDRARREAVARMCENAWPYDLIVNLRIETVTLNGEAQQRRWSVTSLEAFAYGTAITLRSNEVHPKVG